MALVKCPECGREKISDKAVSCPDCGFPIREYMQSKATNGNIEAGEDKQLDNLPTDKDSVLQDMQIKQESPIAVDTEPKQSDEERQEEIVERINKQVNSGKKSLAIAEVITLISFVLNFIIAYISNEFSILFIAISLFCILIDILIYSSIEGDKNRLEIAQNSIRAFDDYEFKIKEDSEAAEERLTEAKAERDALEHPECPMCHSRNTRHLSTVNRAVSIGVKGLASDKIGKQYECKHCGHKW